MRKKLDNEEPKRPGSEEDVHKSMDNGGVIFDEESSVDDDTWKALIARETEIKKAQESRDKLKNLELIRGKAVNE